MPTESQSPSEAVVTARDYYDSQEADSFYSKIWGGEDIHVGCYQSDSEDIAVASRRTVSSIADKLDPLSSEAKVLDIGSGYGGAARYLNKRFGCTATGLNISEVQNRRARELNRESGQEGSIDVVEGDFLQLPFEAESFDVIWSQDALLHTDERLKVLAEVNRTLKSGGKFIFTDLMRSDECPDENLQPVLDRLHLTCLGCPGLYRDAAGKLGWTELEWDDRSHQLTNHYSRVLVEMTRRQTELGQACDATYFEKMKIGLEHWVRHGKAGDLKWGIFVFEKP
ncbi:MAG: sarcosine/dimethylglycine N-methyltransferase [Verrucomicrobiales bacterium]|jgi:sarcosine/dimethylglycine N-methyltransferase